MCFSLYSNYLRDFFHITPPIIINSTIAIPIIISTTRFLPVFGNEVFGNCSVCFLFTFDSFSSNLLEGFWSILSPGFSTGFSFGFSSGF